MPQPLPALIRRGLSTFFTASAAVLFFLALNWTFNNLRPQPGSGAGSTPTGVPSIFTADEQISSLPYPEPGEVEVWQPYPPPQAYSEPQPYPAPGTEVLPPTQTPVPTGVAYTSQRFQVSFYYPEGWQPAGEDAFRGPDGYVYLSPVDVVYNTLIRTCTAYANTNPDLFPTLPELHFTTLQDNRTEACVIAVLEGLYGLDGSRMIIKLPDEGEWWQYVILETDSAHMEDIYRSLRVEQPAASAASQVDQARAPDQPLPVSSMAETQVGDLVIEEYRLGPTPSDFPNPIQFNPNIPDAVREKRDAWRGYGVLRRLEYVHAALQPFGYQLTSIPGSEVYALYHNEALQMAGLFYFRPVSVNGSGTDFILLVEDTTGSQWLVRNKGIQPWPGSLSYNFPPVFAGDDEVWLEAGSSYGKFQVLKNGEAVFDFTSLWMASSPVKNLAAWDGQWVLEVDGFLIVEGVLVNTLWGYDEIFQWQLIDGKPFFFFEKDGQVGASYDGEVLPVSYQKVLHYQCCEPAMYNAGGNPAMVWYYALKDDGWYYGEMGVYR